MKRRGKLLIGLSCALLAAAALGCQMEEEPIVPVRRPSVRTDPCAERLHDVCGQLLLYHGTHRKLPESLEELGAPGSAMEWPPVCPTSGEPYVYNPAGLQIPGQPGRLVLYDARPSHSGMRWGILLSDTGSGGTLAARVLLLPEEAISPSERGP